jgi:hypothetical protein
MRLPFRTTRPQGSPLSSLAFVSSSEEPDDVLKPTERANRDSSGDFQRTKTTVVSGPAFQGRVSRVHLGGDAPPVCSATTVARETPSIWAHSDLAP